jgi:OOP family OmpA-OmpF porin
MNRTITSGVLALLLLPLAGLAQAPAAPWYLSLDGGGALAPDSSVDYGGDALPSRALKFQPGWGVVGTTGWGVGPSFRLEVQVGYIRNGIRSISPGASPSGSVSATTTMLVGRWRWPNEGHIVPFLALGGGRAWLAQNLNVDGGNLTDSSSSTWAYQATVGAFIPLAEHLDLDLSYRYLGTQGGIFLANNFLLYHSSFASHAALAGLTWRVR